MKQMRSKMGGLQKDIVKTLWKISETWNFRLGAVWGFDLVRVC